MNKNIIMFFFYLIPCLVGEVSFSQTNKFELAGYIKGLKTGIITLRESLPNQNTKCKRDTIEILNGKFKFEGEISDPTEMRLIFNNKLYTNTFFLEHGKQQTTINIDSLSSPLIIRGSKSNDEYLSTYSPKMEYHEKRIENWYTDIEALESTYNQKMPAPIADSMENILKQIKWQSDSALLGYIKKYPTSQVAVWNLYYRAGSQGYRSTYDSAFNLIDKTLKKSRTGTLLNQLLNSGKYSRVGALFPIINVIDSFGNAKHIFKKDLNKFTLIDFWFSDCLPCIRQFPELKSIYLTYESKGFLINGVSIDKKENEKHWRNTINKYGLPWPQYWDIDRKEATRLSINAFPSNFLLDNTGKIVAKNLEPFQIESFLRKNL